LLVSIVEFNVTSAKGAEYDSQGQAEQREARRPWLEKLD
jgi:hypothetical protein